MYRDLDPAGWQQKSPIERHPLVARLLGGAENPGGSVLQFPDEYELDDPRIASTVPPIIMDADSSQHSAMIDALKGASMAIQGPPGTGKSQTITNLIAAAKDKSLGIVALNHSQRELILEEIERIAAEDRNVSDYLDAWLGTLEPFFVKNLENVQGDERDVIMISTVYGPNEQGKVMQRFGPITWAAGHRRLNVLFTRAKHSTKVFSSLRPSDIQLGNSSSPGVKALKDYLEFAATGHLHTGETGVREPDNDFERWVADRLRDHGFEAEPRLGSPASSST
jgi:hypothetical protein